METSALKQLLKSLCNNSQWIYAVFWKIKYHSPTILTWEDGYCNYSKLEKCMEIMTEYRMIKERDELVSSYYGTNIHNGDSGSCSVGPAVADMFGLQYALGEGTVGSVASSGNHSWVFLENIFTRDLFSASIYEAPTEWLIQYASGIKTILLVPVLPFGVLQLGSLQMVTENLSVVAYINDRFSAFNFVDGNSISVASDKGVWPLCGSVFESSPFESLDEQTNFTTYMLEAENHGDFDDVKPPVVTFNQFVTIQDVLTVSRRIRPETLHSEKGHKYDLQGSNMEEPSAPLFQSIRASEVEFSDLFSLESLLPPCSELRHYETGLFEGNPHNFHSYSVDNIVGQPFGHNLVTKKEYGSADSFFSFPHDYELQEALGPTLFAQKHTNELLYDSSSSIKDTTSSLMCSRDFKEGDIVDNLLETMVTADDTFSNNTINARIAPVVGKSGRSAKTCCQSESSAVVVDDPALWIFPPESTVTEIGRNSLTSLSISNSLAVNEQEEKNRDITQHRKVKSSNSSRRIKVASNTRQRPRDRQLIQDRIKELRQIVPSGAKCSIDGLLEKTIKHMLYLQRVTDQAEKLKQLAQQEQEGSDSENCVVENENSQSNGASWTWAFDIGSELQVCPIVVEDLESLGHMLIKMLCNDDMGLFLEIAQIIQNLELTIMKGVIEHHSSNSWAHFIVEAPRGFHRLDVFWPLMHLLQRKRNLISRRI